MAKIFVTTVILGRYREMGDFTTASRLAYSFAYKSKLNANVIYFLLLIK